MHSMSNLCCRFSHDEVVHLKGSLINKMPGDYWQKFANWRLLMTLQMTHPGKKLLFMGQEFAQFAEWNFRKELDWHLFSYPAHQMANRYFKDLTKVYKHHPAFYQHDHDPKTFQWLVVDDRDQSVFAYMRQSDHQKMVVILNMTPNVHRMYDLGVPYPGIYEEVLNSDKDIYQGSNQYNGLPIQTLPGHKNGFDQFIPIVLGPLAAIVFIHKEQ
jgi:1,4-alpha-glucan branching enzyme